VVTGITGGLNCGGWGGGVGAVYVSRWEECRMKKCTLVRVRVRVCGVAAEVWCSVPYKLHV